MTMSSNSSDSPSASPRATTMSGRWLDEDSAHTGEATASSSEWPSRARQLGTSASHLRDLSYASALAAAAERLQAHTELPVLLHDIAAEAAVFIAADGTAIASRSRQGWEVLDAPASALWSDPTFVPTCVNVAARAGLLEPGYLPDLEREARWRLHAASAAGPAGQQRWRSLLVAELPTPGEGDQLRLLWYSHRPAAFDDQTEVGALLARHAGLSIAALTERENLVQALEVRACVNRALGVLIGGHGMTADQAFSHLRRQSQHQNVKLRVLADRVVEDALAVNLAAKALSSP